MSGSNPIQTTKLTHILSIVGLIIGINFIVQSGFIGGYWYIGMIIGASMIIRQTMRIKNESQVNQSYEEQEKGRKHYKQELDLKDEPEVDELDDLITEKHKMWE